MDVFDFIIRFIIRTYSVDGSLVTRTFFGNLVIFFPLFVTIFNFPSAQNPSTTPVLSCPFLGLIISTMSPTLGTTTKSSLLFITKSLRIRRSSRVSCRRQTQSSLSSSSLTTRASVSMRSIFRNCDTILLCKSCRSSIWLMISSSSARSLFFSLVIECSN